jgi:hypothetical protein
MKKKIILLTSLLVLVTSCNSLNAYKSDAESFANRKNNPDVLNKVTFKGVFKGVLDDEKANYLSLTNIDISKRYLYNIVYNLGYEEGTLESASNMVPQSLELYYINDLNYGILNHYASGSGRWVMESKDQIQFLLMFEALTETLFRYTYNYWTFDRFNSYEVYYNEIIPAGNIAYSNILTKDEVIKDGYKVLTIKTKKNNSYSTITLTMDNYLVTTHCNIETKNYSSSTISDDYLISTYYYDYSIDYNSDFTYRTSI